MRAWSAAANSISRSSGSPALVMLDSTVLTPDWLAAGGDGVLAAHAAQEVQGAARVLGDVADVVLAAFVDDAVQPTLGGPRLDHLQVRLGVAEIGEVALEAGDELGLGDNGRR